MSEITKIVEKVVEKPLKKSQKNQFSISYFFQKTK